MLVHRTDAQNILQRKYLMKVFADDNDHHDHDTENNNDNHNDILSCHCTLGIINDSGLASCQRDTGK